VNYPKVLIIVLNWNGKDDTLECLESVRRIDYSNFGIVVVDNGSKDGSVTAIQKKFPEIIVLETGKNLGYAGGNNIGIRYALQNNADFILLLNNDTIVDPKILSSFLDAVELVGHRGIFGAKISFYSQTNKIWYAGAKWMKEKSDFHHIGYGCIDDGRNFNSIVETDYACGCALFVSSKVLNEIGLFDERFFLLFEETDLCYRAKNVGIKSFFVPEAKVWHKESTSFGGNRSALYNYFHLRNKLLWAEKNLPFSERLLIYKNIFSELLKCITHLTVNKLVNKAKLLGFRDYFLRRFGGVVLPDSHKNS
jgi:hypothetical protein